MDRYDALNAIGPMTATAGTDAHQNTLPITLRDGERGDSYRRMPRWFSNTILAETKSPSAAKAALAAGRTYISFEAFGTPKGLEFYALNDDGSRVEMGGDCNGCSAGTITLECPTLSAASPQDGNALPDIGATIFKDGEVWQSSCGTWDVTDPGVYRARIDITPNHLKDFLGDTPSDYLKPYPWVYTNAIRVH